MKMNLHYLCNKSGICISLLILLFGAISSIAQTRITGQVKDDKGNPLIYGSVSIENTIDGATTDSTGKFSFKTSAKGKQVLVVSYVGYETKKDTIIIDKKMITLCHAPSPARASKRDSRSDRQSMPTPRSPTQSCAARSRPCNP